MKPRYNVHFPMCRADQKHDTLLFKTNSQDTARAWLDMGMVVFDRVAGQLCYTDLDITFYATYN